LEYIEKRYKKLLPQTAEHQLGHHFPPFMDTHAARALSRREHPRVASRSDFDERIIRHDLYARRDDYL
jgi:hypothetical protein